MRNREREKWREKGKERGKGVENVGEIVTVTVREKSR